MSFNANDMAINLGNYEEYFILYMDNELGEDQRKMVDAFLTAHPDLQAELEILMSTKLPAEEFSFHKEPLLASSMKLNAVEEDLLLYIDNELTEEKKKTVEGKLASNQTYRHQHQQLLQTRLDASELVAYPHKKELYRSTEKVVAFKLWMRIAVAVIVIAATAVLYFAGNDSATALPPDIAVENPSPADITPTQRAGTKEESFPETAIAKNSSPKQGIAAPAKERKTEKGNEPEPSVQQVNDLIARHTVEGVEYASPAAKATTEIVASPNIEAATASFDPSKGIINKSGVTFALSQRKTINAPEPRVPEDVASNNEHKGSFKSFLRKATRLIERKTGIDPTSGEDDELLIGAVALKLN